MSKKYCIKHKGEKKNMLPKDFLKFMEKNYKKQCDMIKTLGSCKECIPDKNLQNDLLKSQEKIKKQLKKCLVCEKIPINRIQNFKIMDTKYKCDSCKKARSLVIELAKKVSKKIDKTKMEKCNKCLKKHSKKKCELKDYVKLSKKIKISC